MLILTIPKVELSTARIAVTAASAVVLMGVSS